ncbi:type II toxin-antitoxin system RelE/ParE family toxin [Agrobacterium sp. rho-13.3]|uniref:type II toxin-antitoxin system RelE/ParE family toxin n=1 Tax=Agrobacterium sp. rho-13.3 TaxID=3072980 RepID=UPI002A0E1D90|nr:type II toxin-antitoxin system RelE/ParE family toxin [Agrobacterium sp. rho-13.3]MDX8307810.1 type II toxin-antitoxin system RelE/ParE family toxin [Agrobacterium sp. rho-13.3]
MKEVVFLGSTLADLRNFPEDVKQEVGFSIYTAQGGGRAINVTPLISYRGASVLEVISNDDGDTFRAVYTTRFGDTIYVLHAFKKKSVRGRATPKKETDLIESRLKLAEQHYLSETKRKTVAQNVRQQT